VEAWVKSSRDRGDKNRVTPVIDQLAAIAEAGGDGVQTPNNINEALRESR
jgi:hypothetical protein